MLKKLKINICIIFIFISCLLTGCSIDTATTLEIDKNEVGKRIMEVSVDKKYVDEDFTGGKEKLDALMKANCPKSITYSADTSDKQYLYTFQLAFTSIEDYKSKVQAILGSETSVEIVLETPDTVFASGVSIEESFSSKDLTKWFVDAVKKEKLASDIESALKFGKIKVIYDGKEYSSYNRVSVNEQKHQSLRRIEVETLLNEDGSFDRSIRFALSKTTYDEIKDEVEPYFTSCVPDEGKGEWLEVKDDIHTYQITYHAKDIDELIKKTKTAVKSESVTFTIEETSGENPISSYIKINENINLSAFGLNEKYPSTIKTKLTLPNTWTVQTQRYGATSGNIIERSSYTDALKEEYIIEKAIPVQAITVKTHVQAKDQILKTIQLQLANGVQEEAVTKAIAYYQGMNAPTVDVEFHPSQEQPIIEFTLKGTIEAVNLDLAVIFNEQNQITYQYNDDNFMNATSHFYETVDMSNLKSLFHYQGDMIYQFQTQDNEELTNLSYNEEPNEYNEAGKEFSSRLKIAYTGKVTFVQGYILMLYAMFVLLICDVIYILRRAKHQNEIDGMMKVSFFKKFKFYNTYLIRQIFSFIKRSIRLLTHMEDILVPSNINKTIYHYFYGSRLPFILIVLSFMLSLVTIVIKNKVLLQILTTICLILPWIAVAIFLYMRYYTAKSAEQSIDEVMAQNTTDLKAKAMKRLGISNEDIMLIDTVYYSGPAFEISQDIPTYKIIEKYQIVASIYRVIYIQIHYLMKFHARLGSDKKTRYNLIQHSFIFFSESQVYTYKFIYDLCTGTIYNEESTEFFYQNITNFNRKSKQVFIQNKFKKEVTTYEYVSIISKSGIENIFSFTQSSEVFINCFLAMRNAIRNKREESEN